MYEELQLHGIRGRCRQRPGLSVTPGKSQPLASFPSPNYYFQFRDTVTLLCPLSRSLSWRNLLSSRWHKSYYHKTIWEARPFAEESLNGLWRVNLIYRPEMQERFCLQSVPWDVWLRLTSSALSGFLWCSNILEIMIQPVVCLNVSRGMPSNIPFPALSKVLIIHAKL